MPLMNMFSLILAVILLNISIAFVILQKNRTSFILKYNPAILVIIAVLFALRVLLPVEFPRAIVIQSYSIVPAVWSILKKDIPLVKAPVWMLLLLVWLIGTITVIINTLLIEYRSARERKNYRTLISSQIDGIAEKLGFKKAVILLSPDVRIPFITGFFKPHIYLPAADMPQESLENILRHEMRHFYLKDIWIKLFYKFVSALFWWNPFIHSFQKDLDQILELRCDASLVSDMNFEERTNYLESILFIAKHAMNRETKSFCTAALLKNTKGSFLKKRIQIIQYLEAQSHMPRRVISMMLVVLVFIGSFFVVIQPAYHPPKGDIDRFNREVPVFTEYSVSDESGFYNFSGWGK